MEKVRGNVQDLYIKIREKNDEVNKVIDNLKKERLNKYEI